MSNLAEAVKGVMVERDSLKAELAAAHETIAGLRGERDRALDGIKGLSQSVQAVDKIVAERDRLRMFLGGEVRDVLRRRHEWYLAEHSKKAIGTTAESLLVAKLDALLSPAPAAQGVRVLRADYVTLKPTYYVEISGKLCSIDMHSLRPHWELNEESFDEFVAWHKKLRHKKLRHKKLVPATPAEVSTLLAQHPLSDESRKAEKPATTTPSPELEKDCPKCGGEMSLVTHVLGRNVGPKLPSPYYACTCGHEAGVDYEPFHAIWTAKTRQELEAELAALQVELVALRKSLADSESPKPATAEGHEVLRCWEGRGGNGVQVEIQDDKEMSRWYDPKNKTWVMGIPIFHITTQCPEDFPPITSPVRLAEVRRLWDAQKAAEAPKPIGYLVHVRTGPSAEPTWMSLASFAKLLEGGAV